MRNNRLKQLLAFEFLFMVILAGIHFLLIEFLLPESYKQIELIYIYIFLFTLSFFGIIGIFAISKNDDSLIGKGFLVFTIIKILSSLLFLLPFILNQDELTRPLVYQFFAVFFPSLLVETLIILKMTNFIDGQTTSDKENS